MDKQITINYIFNQKDMEVTFRKALFMHRNGNKFILSRFTAFLILIITIFIIMSSFTFLESFHAEGFYILNFLILEIIYIVFLVGFSALYALFLATINTKALAKRYMSILGTTEETEVELELGPKNITFRFGTGDVKVIKKDNIDEIVESNNGLIVIVYKSKTFLTKDRQVLLSKFFNKEDKESLLNYV